MRGKFILLTSFLLCLTVSVRAQVDVKNIRFESDIYNFGTVSFGTQKIYATFIFTNTGDVDFKINNVIASCGCTVPSWPEDPIKPGMQGVIQAIFDPSNLAGEVDKSIEVMANFNNVMSKVLYIRGTINEPEQMEPGKIYPGQYGYIRQSRNVVGFGDVLETKDYTQTVLFVNDYNLPLKFTGAKDIPDYVSYSFSNEEIKPGDTITLTLTVHGSKVNDLGLINDEVVFTTNDKFFKLKALKLAFSAKKDFSHLSKRDLKKAPRILVNERFFDMGSIKEGTTVTRDLVIKNTGKTPLTIYKVYTECGCTTVNLDSAVIEPGASRQAKLTFDSIFISGTTQKEVTLYTNDPTNPVVNILVSARVLEN